MITIELTGRRSVTTHTDDFMVLAVESLIIRFPSGHRLEISECGESMDAIMHYPDAESIAIESVCK